MIEHAGATAPVGGLRAHARFAKGGGNLRRERKRVRMWDRGAVAKRPAISSFEGKACNAEPLRSSRAFKHFQGLSIQGIQRSNIQASDLCAMLR